MYVCVLCVCVLCVCVLCVCVRVRVCVTVATLILMFSVSIVKWNQLSRVQLDVSVTQSRAYSPCVASYHWQSVH